MANTNKPFTMLRNYSKSWGVDTSTRLNDIAILQKKLNDLGYDCGTPDGIYGNNTKEAVKQYQFINDLEDDGLVGSGTLSKLERYGDLDEGTIYYGRVSKVDSAVRSKPDSSGTVLGRYPKDTWLAVRTVPNNSSWYATHWKGKTTVSGYISKDCIDNRTRADSTLVCAVKIAKNLVDQKYTLFGFTGAWCQSFCNIVLKLAGVNALQAPIGESNAYDAYRWFDSNGRLYSSPEAGDIVYFKRANTSSTIDHAAFVVSRTSSEITICEGNFGANGDDDYVTTRTVSRNNSEIRGYGRPKW